MNLGPGQYRDFQRSITFEKPAQIRQIETGGMMIFLCGFVVYEDMFERVHKTGFCFRFNPQFTTFNIAGDDAYNYSTTEKKPRPGLARPA